mmetsp:Transcript_7674/g.18577  ORF Transcript_7674/g.18577 Transcript_7674/m.18577 type:complete len:215 (+) Transcript_7674:1911-2555(+)
MASFPESSGCLRSPLMNSECESSPSPLTSKRSKILSRSSTSRMCSLRVFATRSMRAFPRSGIPLDPELDTWEKPPPETRRASGAALAVREAPVGPAALKTRGSCAPPRPDSALVFRRRFDPVLDVRDPASSGLAPLPPVDARAGAGWGPPLADRIGERLAPPSEEGCTPRPAGAWVPLGAAGRPISSGDGGAILCGAGSAPRDEGEGGKEGRRV